MTAAFLLRLIPALVLFSASLLAVFRPPTNILWKLAIVVQGGGHFLVLPCLVLAWLTFRGGPVGTLASGSLVLAAMLFASPLARAVATAHRLQEGFQNGFGKSVPERSWRRHSPLIWRQLLFGIPDSRIQPRTLNYQARDGGSYAIDFYPTARPKAPCVLVIHGGGWDSGNRTDLDPLNRYLADGGYAVASIDYRLAPKHRFPAPIEDVADAVGFLRGQAAALGIDRTRMVLLGRSAGGQIALQAAYDRALSLDVKAVIAYYAPADMVYGYSVPCNPLILDSRKIMRQYLGAGYDQDPGPYHRSSPIEALNASSPPTLLLHGHPDVMVAYEHTLRMEPKLKRLGVPHFTVDLPWATHGFDYIFSGPGSQIGLYFMERFLAQVTM